MKNKKQLMEYMDETFDKVWYVRSLAHNEETLASSPENIIQGMLTARKRIEQQYGLEWYENMDNWEYGFLSGVLATLRWVMDKNEEDKRFLDT